MSAVSGKLACGALTHHHIDGSAQLLNPEIRRRPEYSTIWSSLRFSIYQVQRCGFAVRTEDIARWSLVDADP